MENKCTNVSDTVIALSKNKAAVEILKYLGKRIAPSGDAYFIPKTFDEVEAFEELERFGLVKTVSRSLRVSNDWRVKEGFIECLVLDDGLAVLKEFSIT